MTWWGKLIGGAFGFVLGGPLGAVVGAALGHSFDRGFDTAEQAGPGGGDAWAVEGTERAQMAFFSTTFLVMGHLSKVDGRVSPDEIRLAEDVMSGMQLTAAMRNAAQRLFSEGKRAGFPLDAVLEQFKRECRRSRNLLRIFLELQTQAAYADGELHAAERHTLEHVAARLGFSTAELDAIDDMVRATRHAHATGGGTSMALDDAYAMLELDAGCADADVKKAYRRMMSRHHPDKLVSRGLPEEMMKLATEKTQDIRRAYERVKEARGL